MYSTSQKAHSISAGTEYSSTWTWNDLVSRFFLLLVVAAAGRQIVATLLTADVTLQQVPESVSLLLVAAGLAISVRRLRRVQS